MRGTTKIVFIAALLIVVVHADAARAQTTQDRIDTAIAHARGAGIPVTLLESKVAEGKAKGISMDRIAAAVERRETALEKASQALRGRTDVTPADLSVAADAVESGVSAAVLQAIADAAPRDRRVVAIAALTELVKQGQLPEAALDRVKDALKRGPDALANLPAQAAAGQSRGGGQPDATGSSAGRGRGRGQSGPPASVPAPGGSTEPTKPGGRPTNPGKPTTTPASPSTGRGQSGS
jgi:hypothetical protein